jgi:hypothetical protein
MHMLRLGLLADAGVIAASVSFFVTSAVKH